MKTMHYYAGVLFLATALAAPAQAGNQERVKEALNTVVQDVREAESPAAKRAVLDRFLDKADRNARLMEELPFGSEKQAGLKTLREKFAGYAVQLHGGAGLSGVPDGGLDAFASFMQQDLEQAADAAWGNGGIYLSAGAIIIILLILILIT
jgi:hypothetical protein